jgi:type IV pilus assembly protein PilE
MRNNGFNLIELMIAMAITGILTVIAVPSYNGYVARGKLSEATSYLSDFRARLEQYYQDNRSYGPAGGRCGDTNNDGDGNDTGEIPDVAELGYFTITCAVTAGNNQAYTASISNLANKGLGDASSYVFTVTEANVRRTTAFPSATGLPKNCWIVRAGDSC